MEKVVTIVTAATPGTAAGVVSYIAIGSSILPFLIGVFVSYLYSVKQENFKFSLMDLIFNIVTGTVLAVYTNELIYKLTCQVPFLYDNDMAKDVSNLIGLMVGASASVIVNTFMSNKRVIIENVANKVTKKGEK